MDLTKLADGFVKIALRSADTLKTLMRDELYLLHRRVKRLMGIEEKMLLDAPKEPEKEQPDSRQ